MALLTAGCLLMALPAARASAIQYEFSGVVTSADPSTGVAPGTPFAGTFSYDPSTLGSGLAIEGQSQAVFGASPWGHNPPSDADTFNLQIGGRSIVQESGTLSTSENHLEYPGQYGYGGSDGPAPAHTTLVVGNGDGFGVGELSAALRLSNPSTYVPLAFDQNGGVTLGLFPDATLQVTQGYGPGSHTLYQGTLDTLSTIPGTVPEPSLVPLALAAMAFLAASARKRNATSRDRPISAA